MSTDRFRLLRLLISALLVTGCERIFVDMPADNPEAIFENLWQTFNEEYAPFEERKIDWEQEYNAYRPLVSANTSDDELFGILTGLLSELDDGHVSLTAPGREVFISNRILREKIDDELFSSHIIRNNYLEPGYAEGKDESYIYGKIKNENIAYIFFDHVAENFYELNVFLSKYQSADGYIIDMRHNQGGDFTYCFSEIGRLTDQERFVFRSKTKNGKGRNDYTPWYNWYIRPSGGFIDKSIVVLTDRYTISAGERAVMAFMTLPNVTLIGDTTSGAHGTMIGRELANGWFYSLVTQKVEMNDGKSYEGIGIAPDVYMKNESEEINSGIDMILETAINHLTH